ncbi:isopeptide-forming domain-containing fimbrial protein [Bacillus cereus]|uniref:isopeptide-forming domain-containing fimbrial protein n=1 Tax=Bacillus cereus TaxID=1396 RepID=UPI000BF5851A|nr:isopeptide-forming domain-containing fimbrial protein [Bacillus cereus]PEZ15049.1 cell surface protein [Bacillus cereus]
MKQVLKCFNVVTMITLLLSIILPSPSAFATEINKKSWDELQGNDVKIKADQVNAEMYKGEVAEREHVFQYKIENTGDTPIRELVIKQNNDNGIEFLSQSMKVNGEKLLENKVADFYVEEKDNGGKVLSSNLKIQDLKSHEKMTVLIKARRAQHFNKEYKQKISVQKDQLQIGNMSVDVEGLPSEEKLEANTDDEADSSKKAIGSTTDSKTKEVDGKLKVSVEDKNTSAQKTEIEKIKQPEAEKQLEKEKKQSPLAVKQSDAEVQAASENASKVQIQTGDKQGFGDPLYSTIAPGNLVQTGNVTLGLTSDHYGRQSMGYKTNKMTVDVDNDDSTFNSSTGAFPNIPAGSKVKKAYLFWTAAMGLPGNIADRKVTEDQVRQPVKMRMGNKEYAEVTADSIRKADYLPYISNYSGSGAGYVAYAEVTNIIAQQGISQTLTVANVPQIKDVTGGGYYWGNWNLILVYENYKETVKDMKIWEGLVSQKSTAWTDISVNKINTPKEGAFKAKFSYFSSQGDPADNDGYAYDYGEYDFGLGYQKFKNIKGKDNDVNDSSMTEVQVDGTNEFVTKKYPGYNPDWTNSFSTDIHTYHLEGPTQVKNDLKEGKMRFRAYGGGGDIYVLNNATFVTEHNAPNLQVDKKALDSTGKEVKEIKAGEEFTYQIEVKNDTKNNQAPVSNVKGFDKLDDRLEYVPGSIQYVSGSSKGNKTDDASDDEAEFVNNQIDFRVGEGANAKDGGVLKPGESTVITFKVKVKDSVQSDTTVKNVVVVKGQDSAEIKYETEDDANVTVTTLKEVPGEIEARKIASNKTPKLGDEVEYRITFKNKTKDGRLDVLTIEDELPSSLEYVKDSLKAEGAKPEPVELKFENGKVIAKYPEIMDMEERSIVFKVKVKEEVKVGKKIINKATIDDSQNKPVNPTAEITPQYKDGKLEAKKIVNNETPKLGEEVEYRISFKNTVEHGKLTEVKIEDDLPNGLEYVKNSLKVEGSKPDPVELKFENGKVMAKYPEITDTKERSITFKVKVKGKVSDSIVNEAIVSDTKHPPETPTAEIIPQHKDGKVKAKKTVNNETPKLGEEVEYRISFKNTVEDGKLAEVKIEDTLPEGLEYVENSVKAEGTKPDPVELKMENGKVMAKYPEITDTEERSITFKVKVKEEVKVGKKIVNKAIVDDTKNEPETPTAEITPQHKDGKVEAKKTVNNETPKLGEEVEYRISFKNTVENGKLAEVKIEDNLPNGLEYVKDSLRAEGTKPDPVELKVKDGKVIAKYPEITDTEERSIVFKAKVKEEFKVGEGLVNKVVVDDTKDPTTSEVTITPEYKDGKLKAEKFVNNKKPKLGEEVEYRISFKNTVENGKLVEVTVEDEIPAGLEYVENSLQAEGSKPSPVELKFENGKVMAKYLEITDTKERSIIFKVRVKEEAEVGKEIVNKAIVVDTKNEPEEPHVEITPQYKDGKIAAQKVANNHKPKLGEEVEYRISFKNTVENGKLAEVNIKDALPNGLEYVEGSITAEGFKPKPVELHVKNNKVMAKYPEITDTEERSIVFKAKVKESVKVGEEIVNEAIVDDTKNLPEEPYVPITPQYKDGKIEARKEVSNHEPKLGEKIEYRIIFNNTVKDGKLAEVKIEDKIPAGLEFVEGSEKAEGEEPKPVELKVENGKVMAKYSEIMDTQERSIVFKVKVKDSVTIGKDITNKAIIHVDDPNHPVIDPTAKITPQYKDGKIAAHKKVNNHKPKLGEEIEYRISFNNTVKDGKLAEVKIEDEIPFGLEYVKDSLKAEGDKPAPVELKEEAGKVSAKYENITDMKERSIIFKVKVKDSVEVDKAIVNKAIVDDTKNPPERPEVDITPQHKDGKFKANKKVSKKDPKLGEEVEYRISFKNTVENGKLAEVKIEDQLPNGLEYVKDSLKAEGNEPNLVELKEEAGKITAKYENITDTAERSIIFKVKVTEAVKVGKKIVNTAIVDDDNPKNPPQKPEAIITPEYKNGKIKAEKTVNNPAPKLGEEVEYRITFRNVVEHGKLAKVKIKDELPNSLEFVEGSERAEGDNPKPLHVKVKNGIVLAEYPEITDTKERSIVFKAKVKEKAKIGEAIVNTAVVEDTINPPEKPNVAIQPQHKEGVLQAEKTVSNHEPKLGEEVEYRISFENTVENGKLTEVKVEDEIPAGLEYVQDSIKSDGPEPNPVELKVENGKVTAKYPEITDTKKRSIIFKVKVQETVQVGKEIINKAVVDDNNPTNPPVESLIPITPQYKDGKLEARKEVSNHEPKLGEEIEYRITFNGTVDGGKLVDVKIEDEIPSGLEYVKESLEAVGDKPVPTELKVENGKVTVKYPEIMDTKERSIIFKVKVKESVKVGEEITNKAIIHVDDPDHPVMEPTATIKPEYKDGKLKATKTVNNKEPKLGEEVEYRISFKNTVENGKLAEVKVEDEIPAGLEYVQDSIRFEGAEPNPIELKMEFGKVIAKYLEITDTKERSIIFKVKVKAAPSKGITNRAVVDDKINPPLEPTVTILPKTKEDLKIPEEPKEPEVKPEEPKEPKEPEVKPEEPKEPKEPEVKPEEPKEPKEPEVKPEEPKEPEVKPEEPKDLKKPEVKPEVRLEKLIKEPQVKVEKELPKTGAAHSWMMSVGAGISFLVGGVLFVLGRRRKQ